MLFLPTMVSVTQAAHAQSIKQGDLNKHELLDLLILHMFMQIILALLCSLKTKGNPDMLNFRGIESFKRHDSKLFCIRVVA